jgi:inorganic pyrophosphatase
MAPKTARHKILSEITPFGDKSNDLRVVTETPKGSRNKYSYDPDCDCMELSTVLPEGMIFPYDFGFIPSTLGEDGDPLDILILMEAPVVPGCIVRTRVIGGIEAKQKEKGGSWTKNDRLIAVATHAQTYQKAKTLSDLRPPRKTSVSGSAKVPGWTSWKTLVSVTARRGDSDVAGVDGVAVSGV